MIANTVFSFIDKEQTDNKEDVVDEKIEANSGKVARLRAVLGDS